MPPNTYEVPQTTPPTSADVPELADVVLDMKVLAELAPADIRARLPALPVAYARWIRDQRDRIDDPAEGLEEYRDVAEAAMDTCVRALARIRAGLDLLARDPQAAEAFRYMNRAMWLQRTRSLFAEQRRRGEKVDLTAIDVPGNRSWRPFQLAFILINLPGITDLAHDDRSSNPSAITDLLWFPT